ncbi:MAG: hypothetical protein R6U63_04930 [Longimicrobiales bacterium]
MSGKAVGTPARDERSGTQARWVGVLLWTTAVVAMLSAAVYQRTTGPTYPFRGDLAVAGDTATFALIRSEETVRDARVEVPVPPGADVDGTLVFRRFPTDDSFTAVPLERTGDTLAAALPAQPAAGKLEYRVELETPDGTIRIPGDYRGGDDETVIIRFKDPVPAGVLVPHVLFMFFAALVGVRSGLAAVVGRTDFRRYAWTALGLMTVGGMVLGPIVQKHAFGEFWTGWPNGYDLTDNKTLIMWLVWVVACAVLGTARQMRRRERAGRVAVVAATLVMLAVYLVPHSFRGSQLDYSQIDQGVDPDEAIETGR